MSVCEESVTKNEHSIVGIEILLRSKGRSFTYLVSLWGHLRARLCLWFSLLQCYSSVYICALHHAPINTTRTKKKISTYVCTHDTHVWQWACQSFSLWFLFTSHLLQGCCWCGAAQEKMYSAHNKHYYILPTP